MRVSFLFLVPLLCACEAGRLTVSLTDAPVDEASTVVITFTAVELERDDGTVQRFPLSPPRIVDVLALHGGTRAALLDAVDLRPRDYRALRLEVSADGSGSDSYVEINGARHALRLAAEDEAQLRIVQTITIETREDHAFTVDFDLRRSILPPSGAGEPYRLRPALRLVEDRKAGLLSGQVAADRVSEPDCQPAIYVYPGHSAVADDVGSPRPPVNTGLVRANAGTGIFEYKVALLPAGNHTAVLTCDAGRDRSDADDDTVQFLERHNVSIPAQETAVQNF